MIHSPKVVFSRETEKKELSVLWLRWCPGDVLNSLIERAIGGAIDEGA